jgi:hypothetical protein
VARNSSFFRHSIAERFITPFGMIIIGAFSEAVSGRGTISLLRYLQTPAPLIFVAYSAGFDIVIALLS